MSEITITSLPSVNPGDINIVLDNIPELVPEPLPVESMPEPLPVESMPEPLPVESMPEPLPVESMPEPLPVDPITSLLEILISNNSNINITLTDNQLNIIKLIVSNFTISLSDIHTCILEITKDGKIDAKDIPQFIKIIKDIYTICHSNNKIKMNPSQIATNMSPIIKYIIQTILKQNNIENVDQIICCCDSIIDISMEMIQLQSSLKTKTCNFGFKLY